MNVCGIKEHLFRAPLNKKIMVIISIRTSIFDIFSGCFFLRRHGSSKVTSGSSKVTRGSSKVTRGSSKVTRGSE